MLKTLKGFTGAGIAGAVATLVASPDVLNVLPPKYVHIAGVISGLLAVFGIRRRLPSG